jgi:hypothetical protein
MKRISFLVSFLCACFASAQIIDSLDYREDQFYIDLNFSLQPNDISGFKQNGFSRSVHVGMLRDYPISKMGDKAIAVGMGYGFVRLVNNINIEKTQQSYLYDVPLAQRALRNVFSYHQLQLPVELRWRTSTPSEYAFWRVYLGYRLSYQFGAQYKPFFGRKFSLENQLNELQHSVGVSLGFNTWNLRLDYSLTPLLKDNIRTTNNRQLVLFPLQIGLIFYLL